MQEQAAGEAALIGLLADAMDRREQGHTCSECGQAVPEPVSMVPIAVVLPEGGFEKIHAQLRASGKTSVRLYEPSFGNYWAAEVWV